MKKVCKCKRAYENPLSEICSFCWNELYPNDKDKIKDEDLLESKQETLEQTAVEWLADNIMPMIPFHTLEYRNNFIKFIEQAKEMEKEQIIKARINGDVNGACIFKIAREKAEQYYNETFKSE